MRKAFALAAMAALAGCANTTPPSVVARSTGNLVIVSGGQRHIQDVLTLAQTECAALGPNRTAFQRNATMFGPTMGGTVRFTFECRREGAD